LSRLEKKVDKIITLLMNQQHYRYNQTPIHHPIEQGSENALVSSRRIEIILEKLLKDVTAKFSGNEIRNYD
jgi:hypothetical protein